MPTAFYTGKRQMPVYGNNDSHNRNFRQRILHGTKETAYFCTHKNKKEMNSQTAIWILTTGYLFLGFIFRSIRKMRRETGHYKVFEMEHEETLYDEYDENDEQ